MYGIIVVRMFSPTDDLNWLDEIMQMMPELMSFFGFNLEDITNYQLFVAGYLYDMLFILLSIIFCVMLANRLIFKYLDQGSFVYLISTPNSRTKILLTQVVTLVGYLFLECLLIFLIVAGYGSIVHPGYVSITKLLYLNFSLLFFLLFLSSMVVFFYTIFESKLASSLSIGIPTLFFFLKLISNLGGKYNIVKYMTPFSLFNPTKILNIDILAVIYNLIYIVLAIIIYMVTFKLFKKRDLSI